MLSFSLHININNGPIAACNALPSQLTLWPVIVLCEVNPSPDCRLQWWRGLDEWWSEWQRWQYWLWPDWVLATAPGAPCDAGFGGDTEDQSRDMIGCQPDIPADWWLLQLSLITITRNTPSYPPSICRNKLAPIIINYLFTSSERSWKLLKNTEPILMKIQYLNRF